MTTAPPKTAALRQRRFTVDEYHRMGASGVLTSEDRVQLIDGHIYLMSPIGSSHASCVDQLTHFFVRGVGDSAIVRVQNPVRLDRHSEPEPDIALVKPSPNAYRDRHPRPGDVLLLVEVSDTSMMLDRDIKLPLYARAGIPEVWIVALANDEVHVYREPNGDEFTDHRTLGPEEEVDIRSVPAVDSISTDTILGTSSGE